MNLFFRSPDGKFAIALQSALVDELLTICRAAGGHETGGILAGRYVNTFSVAEVTQISRPPKDSRAGRTWFHRGVRGVGSWLGNLWSKEQYYLGEWHLHPSASPAPSSTDVEQMGEIASSPGYHCPEPLMLIVGGSEREGFRYRAFVYPRGGKLIELAPGAMPEALHS